MLSACEKACGLFDMRTHSGVHPCMGAVDLIPIYPLGEEVGVEDCAKEARGEICAVACCAVDQFHTFPAGLAAMCLHVSLIMSSYSACSSQSNLCAVFLQNHNWQTP